MVRFICISYLLLFTIVAAYSLSYDDDTELDFIWTAATGPVHHYNVYVYKDGKKDIFLEETTETTSYILPGEYGHKYRIEVQAVDAAGNKGPMSEKSDEVICDTTPPWDVNDDGHVNIFDLVTVGSNFGETGDNLKADVNCDSKVDIFDLVLVGSHFGEKTAAPSIHNLTEIGRNTFGWESRGLAKRKGDNTELATKVENISLLQQLYDILKEIPNPTPNLKLALFELEKLLVPDETKLLQNYPNPFNLETWIPFKLANRACVTLNIYDISGSIVRILKLGERPAGVYVSKDRAAYWDGRNKDCEEVSSGLYFYHLKAGDFEETRRMIILK